MDEQFRQVGPYGLNGMALASVLSVRLCVESEDGYFREVRERTDSDVQEDCSDHSTFGLVVKVLQLVASSPFPCPDRAT